MGGAKAGGILDVLDADGDASQRTEFSALGAPAVNGAGGAQRPIRIDRYESVDGRIGRIDVVQGRLRQLGRRNSPAPNRFGQSPQRLATKIHTFDTRPRRPVYQGAASAARHSPVPAAIDLDHVAVAVERHRDAFPRYAGDLGGQWVGGGWAIGFAPGQLVYANGMKVELLRPHRVDENDFLRRFIDRNGPGPHHLTFKVPDIDAMLAKAEAAGYQPVNVDRSDPEWQEAFLHPKAIPGILIQVAQVRGPDWTSPPPDGWPAPRSERPATLERVTHAVRDLEEGMRLYADLLDGEEVDRGDNGIDRWVDLRWPGPGRVRLLTPASAASELENWIGDRRGRVHHVAFRCDRPDQVEAARPVGVGIWEVAPEANFGVRLILTR